MNGNELWIILGAYVGFLLAAVCFGLIVQTVVCWFLAGCITKIPEPYRELAPGSAWVLLAAYVVGYIPCFGGIFLAVYNFLFWPKLSRSFKAYFDSTGEQEVGDCGEKIAMIYCIGHAIMAAMAFFGWIPYLGFFISIAACGLGMIMFVFWIILLVKAGQYKGMIPDDVDSTPEFPITNG